MILEGDPLENIRNTERVDTVVLGGRAYDAQTMNEIVTGDSRVRPTGGNRMSGRGACVPPNSAAQHFIGDVGDPIGFLAFVPNRIAQAEEDVHSHQRPGMGFAHVPAESPVASPFCRRARMRSAVVS